MLCQLSYRGRQPRDCSRGASGRSVGRMGSARGETEAMRRFAVVGVAVFIGVLVFAPSGLAASARVAALQVGLRAHGFDAGPVDGVRGPRTTNALIAFQRARGIRRDRSRRTRDETCARRTRPPTARPTGARDRRRRLGRRGARVPPPALRARPPRRRREVHAEHAASRCGATRVVEASSPTGSQARGRTARSPDARPQRRPCGTSSSRARASSRSLRATTSARGGSRAGTGSR